RRRLRRRSVCRPACTPTPSFRSAIPWENSDRSAAARSPTLSIRIAGASRGAALQHDLMLGACSYRRTGTHFAGTCAEREPRPVIQSMSNPVLVEVLRGRRVESVHRGAVCVADADGATVLALGDVEQPVFPRSAVKALQALPLVESGAADRYRFGDEELAIACGPR